MAVLAGTINTRFVAAINAAGGRAVGLTARRGRAGGQTGEAASRDNGESWWISGCVGEPLPPATRAADQRVDSADRLRAGHRLHRRSRDGQLFNVNADTLAGSLAARLGARGWSSPGGTAGVLDAEGATMSRLDGDGIDEL